MYNLILRIIREISFRTKISTKLLHRAELARRNQIAPEMHYQISTLLDNYLARL